MQVSPHRLFFALFPGPDVVVDIVDASERLQRGFLPGGRPTRAAKLHLTLAFLGEFPATNSDAQERARWVGEQITAAPFELHLDSAFSFGGRRPPWVLGCSDPARALLLPLWNALEHSLQVAGFRPAHEPREFIPHVTLLREAQHALPPTPVAPIHWPVREFVLIDSQPPEYHYVELGRWPLGMPFSPA